MGDDFRRLTDFLRELGAGEATQAGWPYLAHVIGVYRLMQSRGCPEPVCRAGMFHSVYGVQLHQGAPSLQLALECRDEVRELIGERPERLAYLHCAIDRASFDRALGQEAPPYRVADRFTGAEVELPAEDFEDLGRLHLYDWLEQVARAGQWDYRRAAYRRLAERLGAADAFDRAFAPEAAGPLAPPPVLS